MWGFQTYSKKIWQLLKCFASMYTIKLFLNNFFPAFNPQWASIFFFFVGHVRFIDISKREKIFLDAKAQFTIWITL